ncbi:hypothetical protein BVG19_g2797 [[Candida] boidinii]|nr:hypothetical protein BVG19_g2797 [[Candida] boidinii]OWB52866.1 hypothetical protein B5S27_g4449 [[Candida] boidinii]OWB67584.1 hypothetical protein B5S30_g2946 [[Candida] boidinii]
MHFNYIFITLLPLLAGTANAFQGESPSYIDSKLAYAVSDTQSCPESFKKRLALANKQVILNTDSYETSTPVSSANFASQTDSSVTTIEITDGMQFIQSDSDNLAYYADVIVGKTAYPLLIDTASPYSWLFDTSCVDTSCNGKLLYPIPEGDNTSSSESFGLAYTAGTANGVIVTDDLIVSNLKAVDFRLGAANTVPDIFSSYNFSGILGLPSTIAPALNLTNIVSFLKENGQIEKSSFALALGSVPSDVENSGLFLVGKDFSDLHVSDFYNCPLLADDNSYWKIKINSVYVDGYEVNFPALEIDGEGYTNISRKALVDSGTTSIIASKNDASVLHSFFDNSITDGENFAILCNETITLTFNIGGGNWTLAPNDYIGEAYSEDSGYEGYCVSNIQGLDTTTDGSWILGALFLRQTYALFDYDTPSISFGVRNENVKFATPAQNSAVVTSLSSSTVSTIHSTTLVSSTTTSHKQENSNSTSSTTKSYNEAGFVNMNCFSMVTCLLFAFPFLF